MIHSISFEIGGRELSIETGRVAKQAGGAVLFGMGETVILGTATMSAEPREGIDFMPLVCDYEERKYAVGKIPGGFIKRGGRPSEKAVLTSRLIDRPIRPLFPKGLRNEVQCIAMPFAVDQDCPPDVLALNAVSAALAISDIPFAGPVGAVRVGRINGEFVLFPTVSEIEETSDLDLVIAGTKDALIMVEAGANEVTESDMLAAMEFGHIGIRQICEQIEKFAQECGKPKREVPLFKVDEAVVASVREKAWETIRETLVNPDKAARESALSDLKKELVERLTNELYPDDEEKQQQLPSAVDTVIDAAVRELILNENIRPDGRKFDQIRPISCEPGLLPKVHGSGLFTRGQTQVMTVLTLGAPGESQTLDGLEEIPEKKYMHFYNFPPYSVGEVRMLRGPGRREIGHGALAERALVPVLPPIDDFPYTMLLISEVLESNGSTSMASVCGSTLALLDCGVPITAPVAGIAMGLMTGDDKYVVLTDIQGMEDFCGDMDFKVAGTRKGITALQLDTKIKGIPGTVLEQALEQARVARMFILDRIDEAIPERRTELNPNAPQIKILQIDQQKIGELIGPGGRTIKKIVADTEAVIDVQSDGKVFILATNANSMEAALNAIRGIATTPEIGQEFVGKVSRLFGRGAMVEYLPGKEGMVSNEQLTVQRIRHPEEVVNVGDTLRVRIHEIDSMGRVNLTALGLEQDLPALKDNTGATAPPPKPSAGRPDRGRDRGRERNDRGGRDSRDRSHRRESSPRRESSSVSTQAAEEHEPTLKPREDVGFPKKETESESAVFRFRPKR